MRSLPGTEAQNHAAETGSDPLSGEGRGSGPVKGGVWAAIERLRGRSELAALALTGLLVFELLFVLLATAHRWKLVPNAAFVFRSGLAWPFAGLASAAPDSHAFMIHGTTALLLAMAACYLVALIAKGVRKRWVLLALSVAYLIVALSPVLISKDVYLYLAYARIGALHHQNPYVTPPSALGGQIIHYISWKHQRSPYGPIFTVVTYPLGLTSLPLALWLTKLMTVAAALGCVALVWKCAQLLRIPPAFAALAVGLNPLILIYGVAGSHNDFLMMVLVLAGVWLALTARERLGGIATVAAVAVKVAAGPIAPFILMIAGDRRRGLLAAAATAVILVVFSLLIFGPHIFGVLQQADTVGRYSVPRLLGSPFGVRPGAHCARHSASCHARALSLISTVILGLVILGLFAWVLRGGDAITASGWAAVALVATLTSVQPWYFVWVLPLAVLSQSRKLHIAAACLGVLLFVTAWPFSHVLFQPISHDLHRLL